jgi:hypothetical protein
MMARVLFRIEPLNNDNNNNNNNKIFFIYIQAVVKINDFIYTT